MIAMLSYLLIGLSALLAVVAVWLLTDARGCARRLAARINARFARRGEPLVRRPLSRTEVRVAAAIAGAGDLAAGASLLAV